MWLGIEKEEKNHVYWAIEKNAVAKNGLKTYLRIYEAELDV